MSHYRQIKTSITNKESLIAALNTLNLNPAVAAQGRSLTMQNSYSRQDVDIIVTQAALVAVGLMRNEFTWGRGLGWRADEDGTLGMVYDPTDASKFQGAIDRINQEYAVTEAVALATANGYSVNREVLPDGTVTLNCTAW
jgi:hypothetical protein